MLAVENHKRREFWRRSNMFPLANYVRGCLVFMVLSSISDRANSLEIKSALVVEEGYGGKLHEKQSNSAQDASRWRREGVETSENELDSHESSNRKKLHRSQLEYTCGKAVAEKKYRDFFINEAGYQVSRNKYRPTEIRMPRIIGGDDTTPGEFPWTVSVKLNGQPICGGSLIDSSWILTAAHCVVGYNPKNLTIRSGAYRIKDSTETQTVDSAVSMFIIHKEYSIPRPFSNDIALLKLTEPLEYSDFIVPVCLPRPESSTLPDDLATNTITGDYSATQVAAEVQRSSNETGGIVVSTKMSDVDIAQCFTRIEQNYLNSIGMGSTPEPSTSQVQPSMGVSVAPINYLFVQQPTPDHLLAPVEVGPEKGPQRNREHVTQQLRLKPSQVQQYKMQQYLAQMIYQLNGNNKNSLLESYDWLTQSGSRSELEKKSPRKETIKLSKLPISKELLHEIQSVGSGPMQTLVLNQDYFTSGDLTNQLAVGQQQFQPSQPAHEREKVSVYLNNQKNQQAAVAAQLQGPDDPSKYSIGVSGTVVGWGWVRETESGEENNNNKGHSSTTLQKVKLPILHNSVCESWFQSQSKKITLLPSQFCAGFSSGGKDACRGDSGGPMIIEDELDADRYTLIGIVSAGIGCARPSLPGLYTRVASFLPWIRAQMSRY